MRSLVAIWVLAGVTILGSVLYFNKAMANIEVVPYDNTPTEISQNKDWRLQVLPGDTGGIPEDYDIQPAVGYLFVQPATNQAQLLTSSNRILVGQFLAFDKDSGHTTTHWIIQ